MTTPLRIAVGLPQLLERELRTTPGPLLAAYARRAEALAFDGLWTLDSAVGGPTMHMPTLDAVHALTFAAAVTERIALGVAVIVLPRRNPALLAKELASVDQLSGGRVVVGVGLGGSDDTAAAALGFPTGRRVRRLNEGIETLRRLWTQERASFDGELYRFDDLPLEPKPAQRPGPAIWLGGGSDAALARAVRIADGWIGSGSSAVEDFVAQAARLHELLEEAGRDPATLPLMRRVYVHVDDDERRGGERLAALLDRMYGRPGLGARCAVAGSAERIAERVAPLLEAGAGELLFSPLLDAPLQLERLAEVAALLRG